MLEVEDHGRGVTPGSERQGLGLVGMRERATLIGGVLAMSRPTEGGTRICLTVPLPATDAAHRHAAVSQAQPDRTATPGAPA